MTGIVIALGIAGSGSVGTTATPERSEAVPPRAASEPKCPSAHRAVRFYQRRYREHRATMGAGVSLSALAARTSGRNGSCPRYLAQVWKRKAYAWRVRAERWVDARTLRDHRFCEDCHAWRKAVREVQRVFPGTESWLMSCSAAEGGWGRWVGYSGVPYSTWLRDSDTVGGPLQFRFSTFKGMYRRGVEYITDRGYRVPRMDETTAWRSALGQAIAGGWARYTGNDDSHWSASFGRGC